MRRNEIKNIDQEDLQELPAVVGDLWIAEDRMFVDYAGETA